MKIETGTRNELPYGRNHTDDELKQILNELDDGELHALKFGMLPVRYSPENTDKPLTGKDMARLMGLNPKGCF